jgi:uncharacterized phage protein (TIGR02220 family)
MRVNMDSSMVGDPRFRVLATELGWHIREVFGACYLLWLACYERRAPVMESRYVDAAVDHAGFADALVSVGLADAEGPDSVRIHGVDVRILFLQKQAEKGRKGGQKSAGKRRRRRVKANAQANGSGVAQAYPPAPAPAPDQERGGVRSRARALALVGIKRLNAKVGSNRSATSKVTLASFEAIAREGYTVEQVIAVVDAKVAEWGGDEEMQKNLRPSTLFRPSNFRRYADDIDGAPQGKLATTGSSGPAYRYEDGF